MMTMLEKILVPLGSAALGAAAAIVVGLYGSFDKNREMDIKMLELSLQILREDPDKSQIKAARGWAVDLINNVSPVKIPPDARAQLISNKLPFSFRMWQLDSPDNLSPEDREAVRDAVRESMKRWSEKRREKPNQEEKTK